MKKCFLSIILIFLYYSCELVMDNRYLITLVNNTESTLNFHVASENSALIYPDTILPLNNEELSLPKITKTVYWGDSQRWEERIAMLSSDTLSIYFFHPDTLATYDWNTVRNEYKILKRYDLSIQDLKTLNFKVVFPPTLEMSHIKQYPSE